jgi:protein-tyrosine phosphatase
MIDIHSHILPGIDDGPRDWEKSIALCRSLVGDGIETAVATPHLIDGVFENISSRVGPLVDELNGRLRRADIALTVLPGAEVDFSSRYAAERTDELPSLGGGRAVLLEMPVAVIPPAISQTIFALRSRGFFPVFAHPERNELIQDRPGLVREWLGSGALLQLDGDSLLGVWGKRTQACAEHLLRRGLFHAMASDAHSTEKRPPRLTEALERAVALVGEGARELVTNGPRMILAGEDVPTPLYGVDESCDRSTQLGRRARRFHWLGWRQGHEL